MCIEAKVGLLSLHAVEAQIGEMHVRIFPGEVDELIFLVIEGKFSIRVR